MGKVLFWLLIILGAMVVARLLATHKLKSRDQAGARSARGTKAGPSAGPAASAKESMVRCAHCHIYLPRSEAMLKGGETWCCDAHAKLGKRLEKR